MPSPCWVSVSISVPSIRLCTNEASGRADKFNLNKEIDYGPICPGPPDKSITRPASWGRLCVRLLPR